jgi:hypothetical protein
MKTACSNCLFILVPCIILAATSNAAGADEPYFGKWKLNPAKSQLTGGTAKIERLPSGAMRFSEGEISYEFRLDGKEYPIPGGFTTSWKEVGQGTWEVRNGANGRTAVTFYLTVKGDTMTSTLHRNTPDGRTVEESSILTRIAGGPGLLGTWKQKQVKAAASTWEFRADGKGGFTMTYPDTGDTCTGKFDGKDYPIVRIGTPLKETLAFRKTGDHSFEVTEKVEGKPAYVDVYTVSRDGRTLIDEGNVVGKQERTKAVYERQ